MASNISTYGLVGYPVEHSLSPLMHNAAFNALEVEALYELFSLKPEEVAGFINGLRDENSPIFGLNVTVPYKEKVVPLLDSMTPFATKVGAVNTIVVDKGRKLIGYNTDGPGFLAHLKDLEFETDNKRISILGAGGAARAIVSVLCLVVERPQSILIYDVDKGKADALIEDLGERVNVDIVKSVNSIDDLNVEIADLLVNATPIGMKEADVCLIEPDIIHSDMLVYDLVYNPAETKLLKNAILKGAKAANGLGMLFYQGVLAFQHWADLELDDNIKGIMKNALEEGLNNK